jgi:hypothetical protein
VIDELLVEKKAGHRRGLAELLLSLEQLTTGGV